MVCFSLILLFNGIKRNKHPGKGITKEEWTVLSSDIPQLGKNAFMWCLPLVFSSSWELEPWHGAPWDLSPGLRGAGVTCGDSVLTFPSSAIFSCLVYVFSHKGQVVAPPFLRKFVSVAVAPTFAIQKGWRCPSGGSPMPSLMPYAARNSQ